MPFNRLTLSVAAPEGWFRKEQVMLLAPDGQAFVIASSEPLDPTISAQQYAEIQGELLAREYPGFRQTRFEACVAFGSLPGFVRDFSWTPREGSEVIQIQCYAVTGGRGYTATATAVSTAFAEREPLLRRTLLSAVIAA